MIPRENKNNAYAKFEGTNNEYYGIFRNGQLGYLHFTHVKIAGKSDAVMFFRLKITYASFARNIVQKFLRPTLQGRAGSQVENCKIICIGNRMGPSKIKD